MEGKSFAFGSRGADVVCGKGPTSDILQPAPTGPSLPGACIPAPALLPASLTLHRAAPGGMRGSGSFTCPERGTLWGDRVSAPHRYRT